MDGKRGQGSQLPSSSTSSKDKSALAKYPRPTLVDRKLAEPHSIEEYRFLTSYMAETTLKNVDDQKYYEQCKNDLRKLLAANKDEGIKVRNIRTAFRTSMDYEVDLKRVHLKNWVHLLLSCKRVLRFFLESHPEEDKEILYVFGLEESSQDQENPYGDRLVPMDSLDAYMKGFLDPADGVRLMDPRVPVQDLGVNAQEILRKTQVSKGQPSVTTNNKKVTMETTSPIPQKKKTNVSTIMEMIDQSDESTSAHEPFQLPIWERKWK